MIKLIASDLDGTLLWGENKIVRPESKQLIEELLAQGRMFFAASGRQYGNQRRLFGEIQDKIGYVSDNGSLIMNQNQVVKTYSFERELGIELMKTIQEREDCEVLLSGVNISYIQPKDPEFEYFMKHVVKNNVEVVDDICAVEAPFLKIAAYCKNGSESVAHDWDEKFGGRMNIALADEIWLDFGPLGAGKGIALQDICRMYGFSWDEMLVMGDHYNDISMLQMAGYPVVMENGQDEVKKYAKEITADVNDILRKVLEGKYD